MQPIFHFSHLTGFSSTNASLGLQVTDEILSCGSPLFFPDAAVDMPSIRNNEALFNMAFNDENSLQGQLTGFLNSSTTVIGSQVTDVKSSGAPVICPEATVDWNVCGPVKLAKRRTEEVNHIILSFLPH